VPRLRILVVARDVPERGTLDLIGLPEAGRRRGHVVEVVPSAVVDVQALCDSRSDAIVCRFSGEVAAAGAVRVAARLGTPVIGGDNGRWLGDDQIRTLDALQEAAIPTPQWRAVHSAAEAEVYAAVVGYPIVVKHPATMGGGGVRLAQDEGDLLSLLLEVGVGPAVLQQFVVESRGQDIRVLVVGRRVVGSIRRVARAGEFRANLGLGGSAVPHVTSTAEADLAIAAAEAVGLDVAGIDMLQTMNGPLVVEVNHNPGVTGIPGAALAIIDLVEARVSDRRRA
jgi:ribosomal protein S6--L-glutamate ligase